LKLSVLALSAAHEAGASYIRLDPVEPPADGNVLICCSRPQGDIVLDL
jgi:hypothetical protein